MGRTALAVTLHRQGIQVCRRLGRMRSITLTVPVALQAVGHTVQASDTDPLSDSDAEAAGTLSPSSSPKKRKRSDIEPSYLNSRRSPREVGGLNNARTSRSAHTRSNSDERVIRTGKWNSSPECSDGEQARLEQDPQGAQLSINARSRRGKRRITKAESRSPSSLSVDDATEPVTSAEALDSNPDDAEMEEHGEYGSHDNATKDEEGGKHLCLRIRSLIPCADGSRHEKEVRTRVIERYREVLCELER